MNDLGLDLQHVRTWFPREKEVPYVLVRVTDAQTKGWADALGIAVRRCYVTDAVLSESAAAHKVSQQDVIAAKLPDAGSTMSGDFGEILVYLFQGTEEHPKAAIGATKWRLKQERKKPAPFSDVVHFFLPSWPMASADDVVLCSEVKAKSGAGAFAPIKRAIEGCEKDRTSRLAGTLVWLRERALTDDLGDLKIEHLNRFIEGIDHPPAQQRFRAVAVIAADLLEAELADAPVKTPSDYTVVVISVPELKATYTSVFDAARQAVAAAEAALATQGYL
jgi:Cap4 SAVED domain